MKRKILTYAGIVLAFLVLAYGFVPQVLGGKIVNQSDISGWQGMSHEMMEWNAAHPDDQTAWTGSMFSGMPTTTIHASTKGDWTQAIYDLLLTGKRPATYLFISLLGAFLLMLSLGISPLVAAFGAVAVSFCSYNIQIIQVGHNTKMQALAFLPWVLAAVVFTYRQALEKKASLPKTFLGAALFGLALSMQIKANHPQISYYLAMMILIYALVMLVWILISKERRQKLGRFFVASALLLVLGFAGIGTNAIKLLPTAEYTPFSMRGGTSASDDNAGKERKGLDIAYATAWSYGWEELPNLMIPNFNGGASAGAVNPSKSETYALLKKAGQPNLKEICKQLPLYWGPQPFTAGPMYMGAITVFLFIFALMYYKDRKQKWWIVIASAIAVLLSLGNHFLWFTKLFYNCVPLYNKFRTVSMALVILQFTLPVLGFLMLDDLIRSSEDPKVLRKQVLKAAGVSLGLCFLFALVQSLTGSFSSPSDAGQPEVLSQALAFDRHHLLWSDTGRSMLLIACSAVLLFWGLSIPASAKKTFETRSEFVRSRRLTSAVLVGLLVLLDLFIVDRRYLNEDHFTTPKAFRSQFNKRPVDEIILKDTDPSYRVLDLTVNVFNDSHPSYWHKNIGGYSPAKLQRYQEFIDSELASEINTIYKSLEKAATVQEAEAALPELPGLSALNCRYIIVGADNAPLRYPYARGNAWFESAEGSVTLDSYAPNELRYSCSSGTGGRMVFSEIYYPKGWNLTLEDGTALKIDLYDGNDGTPGALLRCADIPAGNHTLVMRFSPRSYSRGEAISRCCSVILLLIVLLAIGAEALCERKTGI